MPTFTVFTTGFAGVTTVVLSFLGTAGFVLSVFPSSFLVSSGVEGFSGLDGATG